MSFGLSNLAYVHIGIVLLLWSTAVESSLGTQRKNKAQEYYLAAGNNGALQLIIEAYVDSILRDLQNDGGTTPGGARLDHADLTLIRNRMKGLHQHLLTHPAINERRLWISPTQPHFDPYFWKALPDSKVQEEHPEQEEEEQEEENDLVPMERVKSPTRKRNHEEFVAEEICATNRSWNLIYNTKDLYGREVEVIQTSQQRQWIFYYDCIAESRPCSGISKDYTSKCEMRHGWVGMYHRVRGESPDSVPIWGFVETPHHCACKITRKPRRSINCSD